MNVFLSSHKDYGRSATRFVFLELKFDLSTMESKSFFLRNTSTLMLHVK